MIWAPMCDCGYPVPHFRCDHEEATMSKHSSTGKVFKYQLDPSIRLPREESDHSMALAEFVQLFDWELERVGAALSEQQRLALHRALAMHGVRGVC